MGLFGPPNIEKMKANHDVNGLIKALAYQSDSKVRRDAASALGEVKDAITVEPLIAALKDREYIVRQSAVNALGKLKDARAVEPLIAVLKDRDFNVRQSAAIALGKLKDARAVEPLIIALNDTMVTDEAILALGEIGAPAVDMLRRMGDSFPIAEFIHALKGKSTAAAVMLGNIGNARAVEPLIAALTKADGEFMKAIYAALGNLGGRKAEQELIDRLKWESWSGNALVADALEKTGWQPGRDENGARYWIYKRVWEKCVEIGAPAVEPLAHFIEDCHFDEKNPKGPIWALGEIGEPGIKRLLVLLDGKYHREAADALGKTGWQPGRDENGARYWIAKGVWEKCVEIGAPAIKPLIDKIKINEAANALVKIGMPAVEPLIDALKGTNQATCSRAAKALGEIGDARAVEPLIAVIHESYGVNIDVENQAATQALVKIGIPAVKPLLTALMDPEEVVRWYVAEALIGLYQAGQLDATSKNLILDHRGEISAPQHLDIGSENCGAGHLDHVAVEFPL